MDEGLWIIICSKAKRSRCYPPAKAALNEQGKVAIFQTGHDMETIDCYWTAITISIELVMVEAKQCLDS